MSDVMATTYDNPYDYFTEYDRWFQWDMVKGYNTPGLIARVIITSEALSEADQAQAFEYAIDEIVDENVSGVHVKVTRET